jgi:histidinol phosphatase-like enzyme
MANQAKKDFPNIDFTKIIIIGNKLSDMQFGRNAGMHTIYVATTNPEVEFPHPLIDMRFNNLLTLAVHLQHITKS